MKSRVQLNDERKEELKTFLLKLKEERVYKVFISTSDHYAYALVSTPFGVFNIHYQPERYDELGGWVFNYRVPSTQSFGNCIRCLVSPVGELTAEIFDTAVNSGLAYARSIKAKTYRDNKEAMAEASLALYMEI